MIRNESREWDGMGKEGYFWGYFGVRRGRGRGRKIGCDNEGVRRDVSYHTKEKDL